STAMGSGTSRGKKVAPACVSEVTRAGGAGVHPSQQARGPFNQRKVQGRNSEGPHSECSGEDDDTLRGDHTDGQGASPRRTFIWSKTRGLCPFSREDTEDETSSSPQLDEPRVPRRGPQDVNKRSNCVFTHRKPHTPAGVIQRHKAEHSDPLTSTPHKEHLEEPVALRSRFIAEHGPLCVI
ncbi:hypothetical protein XENOCAPTIV_000796, partial [Xenoophorus captivus]